MHWNNQWSPVQWLSKAAPRSKISLPINREVHGAWIQMAQSRSDTPRKQNFVSYPDKLKRTKEVRIILRMMLLQLIFSVLATKFNAKSSSRQSPTPLCRPTKPCPNKLLYYLISCGQWPVVGHPLRWDLHLWISASPCHLVRCIALLNYHLLRRSKLLLYSS